MMLHGSCRCLAACSLAALLVDVPVAAQSLPAPTFQGGESRSQSSQTSQFRPGVGGTRNPFAGLFRDTIADFGNLPSRDNAILAGIGAVAASVAHPYDLRVSQSWSASPRLETTFGAGEFLGSASVQLASAVATQVIGKAIGHRTTAAIGSDLVRAQILTQTMTAGIKLSVRRTRPDGTQFSFPSGHASTTFATATVLQRHLGWKAGIPAYGLAAYVAASRVQVQRHHLSDVTIGAALGIIAGRAVTVGRGDVRFALGPSAVPGGAGVNFTWLGKQ